MSSDPFKESYEISIRDNAFFLSQQSQEILNRTVKHICHQAGSESLSPGLKEILTKLVTFEDVQLALRQLSANELAKLPPIAKLGLKDIELELVPVYKAIMNLVVSTYFRYKHI